MEDLTFREILFGIFFIPIVLGYGLLCLLYAPVEEAKRLIRRWKLCL